LEMALDRDCKVVLTLSGAMTIAKMGKVIAKMIDSGLVQAVVSTGALIAHGLTEAMGLVHYRHDPRLSDRELFQKGYNRVYDTVELETSLNTLEEFSSRAMLSLPPGTLCSEVICRNLGRLLSKDGDGGVLGSAYRNDVPIYIPAFTDSELGLDLATWHMRNIAGSDRQDVEAALGHVPDYNPYLDLASFARFALRASRLGIFTIGGGVPRNWAQEVGPYVDIVNLRLGLNVVPPRYRYAVRLCPEPAHWGGLSGCTYSEGVSWGKFIPEDEGGRFAEVYADATTVWPLLLKATLEELQKDAPPPKSGNSNPEGVR